MSKEELKALIKPLSREEKSQLIQLLEEDGYEEKFDNLQAANPLKGLVIRYDDPFGAAIEQAGPHVNLAS